MSLILDKAVGEKSSVVDSQALRAGYNLLSSEEKEALLKKFENEKETFSKAIRVSPGSKVKDASDTMKQVGFMVSSVHLVSIYDMLIIASARRPDLAMQHSLRCYDSQR